MKKKILFTLENIVFGGLLHRVNDPVKDIDVSSLAKGAYQLDIVTPQNKNLHQRFLKN